MTRGSTAAVGRAGERAAERYLRSRGYRRIARNVRLAGGELDLVMRGPDGRTIVVIEVKARMVAAGSTAPRPEANITAAKRAQVARLTESLRAREGWRDVPVRIDVIAVEFDARSHSPWRWWAVLGRQGRSKGVTVRHHPNAFGAK